MTRLNNQLSYAGADDLVAGFTPQQLIAQVMGTQQALDPNGDLAASTGALRDTVDGVDISQYISGDALNTLSDLSSSRGVPQEVLDLIQSGDVAGVDMLGDLANSTALPDSVVQRLSSGSGVDTEFLNNLLDGKTTAGTDALASTANGDFLFGGDGFNAAVEAAVRQAQPGIISQFAGAGVGGGTGALAQEAISRAAVDAFASQFANERGNQLGAANSLASLEQGDRAQTADIAEAIQGLNLAGADFDANTAETLGRLTQSGIDLSGDLAAQIAGFDLSGRGQDLDSANLLASLFTNENNERFDAASLLANLGIGERANSLAAAERLPGISTLPIELLSAIGGERQSLNQAQLEAPINANLQMIQAALAGVPIESLLGGKTKTRSHSLSGSYSFGGVGG
ncbi:MAG: hypothetical protein AAF529_20180 [Pseudomonadota bacterium]